MGANLLRRHRAALVPIFFALPAGADVVTSASDLVERVDAASIVILGEVHDNPAHHAFQNDVMEALDPSSVVFEMLSEDEARLVTPELASDMEALEAALNWAESGWPDFTMYYPLIATAARTGIYGAEVPRNAAQRAFGSSAASVFSGNGERFGLAEPLDPEQQAAREAEQQDAHCNALPEDILPGFVEAQRLRDASLAEAALAALETHGAPVVIVTGNGHARTDWGVPTLLARAAPDIVVFSLGQFEAEPEARVPFDAWTVADPVDRPDPCAAFR